MLIHDLGTGPFRRACDRCHRQKLRCKREASTDDCLRCQRAKARCVITPSRSRLRAHPLALKKPSPKISTAPPFPIPQPVNTSGSSNAQRDIKSNPYVAEHFSTYPFSLLGLSTNFEPNLSPPESPGPFNVPTWRDSHQDDWYKLLTTVAHESFSASSPQFDSPSGTNTGVTTDTGTLAGPALSSDTSRHAKKLSDLSTQLQQLLSSIPSVSSWEATPKPETKIPTEIEERAKQKRVVVDEVLRLSQEYTEVLNFFFPRFHSMQFSISMASARKHLDESLELLILSSYLCLVEIYDHILQHFAACVELRSRIGPPKDGDRGLMCIPPLTIGSFEIKPTSSTQMVVIMHLMEAMMTRVHDLIGEMAHQRRIRDRRHPTRNEDSGISSETEGGDRAGPDAERWPWNDPLSSVMDVTLRAIRSKEEATMRFLATVRQATFRVGIL